jgi:hypothetical protein
MAVWSLVGKDSFAFGERFDAEFYQPAFLQVRKKLSKCSTLGSFLEDIRYGLQAEPEYLPEGAEYIRAMNLNVPWIEGDILRINPEQIPSDDYRLRKGDILITRTGANCGAVGIITERFTGATYGSYTIRLRTKDAVNPFALFAFLLSHTGKMLTTQARYGSAQPNLSIPYLRNLVLVPNFSETLGSLLERLILDAVKTAHSEVELYRGAEDELLDRLGWDELQQQSVELSYVCDFADITSTARADPEFFQPKYDRLALRLIERGAQSIGTFCPKPRRGVQPEIIEGGDVVVVDSKAVRPQGVEPAASERTSNKFFALKANAKARAQIGDVLLNSTGRGTLGRAACYQLSTPALCDNHVAILRPDPKVCDPVYLALFLNSPAGLAQSEQFQTGSSGQLEIYPQHIQKFLIYIPRKKNGDVDLAWQKRLAAKVEASAAAKVAARAKLDEAKQLVEESLKY